MKTFYTAPQLPLFYEHSFSFKVIPFSRTSHVSQYANMQSSMARSLSYFSILQEFTVKLCSRAQGETEIHSICFIESQILFCKRALMLLKGTPKGCDWFPQLPLSVLLMNAIECNNLWSPSLNERFGIFTQGIK